MKKVHNSLLWAIVGLFAVAFYPAANAQDDLYYDPATDAPVSTPPTYTEEPNGNSNVTRRYDDDEGYYDDDDDYAYEYSSRIRRFQRRSPVVDYYDPYFVDLYNYDPFFSPGTSIYVYNYNDYWSYRRWQRWNRWNSWNSGWGGGWGAGWNSWGWNSAYSFNSPWYNPWVVNNYYYDPYWTCNGYNPYFQNQFYGNGWSNNHYYYDNNNGNGNGGGYSPKTYTGPRRNGSSVNPGYARIADSNGRLTPSQTNAPVLERTATRPGRTAGDIESNSAAGRGNTATPSVRRPDGSTAEPTGRARTPETAPVGRGVENPSSRNDEGNMPRRTEDAKPQRTETPSPRNEEGYKPRRSEETPSRPQRTETPTRRINDEGGTSTPRRTESAPSRTEESRPARRTEERSNERPSRSNNNDSGRPSQESRPSRSSEGGNSAGSNSGGSSRGSDSGSSKSSSGSKSGGNGRGGRN